MQKIFDSYGRCSHMHDARIFSTGGIYGFVVAQNLLAHREAADRLATYVERWLQGRRGNRRLRVLDLACGGQPVTVCELLRRHPECSAEYWGIDIHPDQVAAARAFTGYPDNVEDITISEGNAWLPANHVTGPFDLIYSGLNFHHAVPEELVFLAQQLRPLMHPDALLLNHDMYRPTRCRYLRRPADPQRALVPNERLQQITMPCALAPQSAAEFPDWRLELVDSYCQHLARCGADPANIQETRTHILDYDFPVSLPEMAALWESAGYTNVTTLPLTIAAIPLREYLGVIAITGA